MSLLAHFKKAGPSGFGYGSTATEVTEGLDLTGRHILITGCNSGLGAQAMAVLCQRGATVIAVARTQAKAQAACAAAPGTALPVVCELSEPKSVAACVQSVVDLGVELDAIICNAGIMALPTRQLKHGLELQFLTNHIGHFILVTGLLKQLAPAGRVVVLSSAAHVQAPSAGVVLDDLACERGYSPWKAYGQAKLANLLFARELSRRLPAGQVANAVHPGVINTGLGRHMNAAMTAAMSVVGPLFTKTIPQGAATEVWAAVHPDAATVTGQYLKDCNVSQSNAKGQDMELAAALWTRSEQLVAGLLGDQGVAK